MTPEELKAKTMRFYDELFNARDLSLVDEFFADDFVEHEEFPGLPQDKSAIPMFIEMMTTAFPDMKMVPLSMVAQGDEVWVQIRITGTHKGEFLGIPATDQKFDIGGFDRIRIRDGKAIEHWGVTDQLAMMQQLGLAPMPD